MRKESITCNYSKINSQVKHPGFQGLCSMLTIQQFIRLNQKLVIASLYPCQPVLEIYPLLKFRVLSHGDKDVCPSFFLLCRQIINSFITPPTPLNRIWWNLQTISCTYYHRAPAILDFEPGQFGGQEVHVIKWRIGGIK